MPTSAAAAAGAPEVIKKVARPKDPIPDVEWWDQTVLRPEQVCILLSNVLVSRPEMRACVPAHMFLSFYLSSLFLYLCFLLYFVIIVIMRYFAHMHLRVNFLVISSSCV